jgi:hypothetical protein
MTTTARMTPTGTTTTAPAEPDPLRELEPTAAASLD